MRGSVATGHARQPIFVDDVKAGLATAGFEIVEDATLRLAGLLNTLVLLERNGGHVERAVNEAQLAAIAGVSVLFVHRELGRVRGDLAKEDEFVVEGHDGRGRYPAVVRPKSEPGFTAALDRGCEEKRSLTLAQNPNLATGSAAPPAAEVSADQLDEMIALFSDRSDASKQRDETIAREIFAKTPPRVGRDPFDRTVVLLPQDKRLLRPCLSEPMLYLHSDVPRDVVVRFAAPLQIVHTDPPLRDGAWSERAAPTRRRIPPTPARRVRRALPAHEIPARHRRRARARSSPATRAGTHRPSTAAGARRARACNARWVEISLIARTDLDRLAPVVIEPRPDVFIRLAVVLTLHDEQPRAGANDDLDTGTDGFAARELVAPARAGFVAAEWGAVFLDARMAGRLPLASARRTRRNELRISEHGLLFLKRDLPRRRSLDG